MLQLNTAFNHLLPEGSPQRAMNISPEDLREWIEITNNWLVPGLVEGVYRAGFSPDQESYDKACKEVFETLERLEGLLTAHAGPFILKDKMTEVDIRAYPTLVRFDTVYHQHFKVNIGSIRHNYPKIHRYLKNMH